MHIRRAILEDLKGQLKALVDAGKVSVVLIQRAKPNRNTYPLINLYSENEQVDNLQIHDIARDQDRQLNVSIDGWIKGSPDDEKAEKAMDALALLIEQTLVRPANAEDFRLTGTDQQFADEELLLHTVTLTYQIDYSTIERNPTI